MCMTGSDLCSSQKPWENQESTAKVIYDEFYEQVFIEPEINENVFCKRPSLFRNFVYIFVINCNNIDYTIETNAKLVNAKLISKHMFI